VDKKPIEVLLIEDSIFAAKHTEKMLAEAKSAQFEAKLQCANQLSTGLKHLAQGGIDIVLLDLTLPDAIGLDTFMQVRTQAPEVPIVVLSGLEDEILAINAVQKGAQDYLIKGHVDSNLLKRSILYAIERKRAEEELKKHREHLEELVEERTAKLQQEIAERKKAEEALSASEVRYRRLFEAARDGILILDAETGMIIDVNPFLIEMLGFSHEQLLEKAIWEIGCFNDIASNKAKFMELQRQGYVRHEDLPLETADGRQIEVEFISNVYEMNHQKVIQCNIRDITERKRAEEKLRNTLLDLERSNKELQQFAYVASHDLQEPLRMVASYTQLLEKRYRDRLDSDANEFIQFAVDGAIRMQRLINDLLAYSRVGTRSKPFEPIDSHGVLGQAIANLSAVIEENQAVVTNDDLPPIMADQSQMVQLFQNLIGNAIKFRSDQSPRIHVSAEQKGNEWVFSVEDNGIGIDPQFKERIFVVFKRLHQKEEYPGTGMGLAICKKIVERHGGRMWVESELQKGSTFYFSIPVMGRREPIEVQAVYEMA
jgi:PAS domain S-box-containing protein